MPIKKGQILQDTLSQPKVMIPYFTPLLGSQAPSSFRT